MPRALETIPVETARTLLLQSQGLLDSTSRSAAAADTFREIQRLGFVQLDSINIVERAHHHILYSRLHDYRPATLDELQRSGKVFEHWTHDASIIPADWFPHWRHRFDRVAWNKWLRSRMGRDYRKILDAVIERIRKEGPLQARDFEHGGKKGGPWWDWKPAKAALEYWWRRGELAVPRRVRFEKVYDLTERVLPHVHALPLPERETHIDWACRSALERLGIATPREISAFWNFLDAKDVLAWGSGAEARGEVVRVHVEAAKAHSNGKTVKFSYAVPDWKARVAAAPAPPGGIRLLSPFDPLIRDRARCRRLFGFDYRFEAFVPEARRAYGYYVLPILRADRIVGRLDPRLDRENSTLHIRRVWWQPEIKPSKAMKRDLDRALDRYARFAGAARVEVADGAFAEPL